MVAIAPANGAAATCSRIISPRGGGRDFFLNGLDVYQGDLVTIASAKGAAATCSGGRARVSYRVFLRSKRTPLGPYRSPTPRVLGRGGGGGYLMGEAILQAHPRLVFKAAVVAIVLAKGAAATSFRGFIKSN